MSDPVSTPPSPGANIPGAPFPVGQSPVARNQVAPRPGSLNPTAETPSSLQPALEALPADLFDWPVFGLQDDVRPALARARGEAAVLATLHAVQGGAPRGVGAQMLLARSEVAGFLSGGCIEADVALHARTLLDRPARGDRRSHRLIYGEGGPADIQLPCGSRIDVLLEVIAGDDWATAALLEAARSRRPAVWLTDGDTRVCLPTDAETTDAPEPLQAALRSSRSGRMCGVPARTRFSLYRRYDPPLRLLAVGADPVTLAVVRLAVEMGLQTTLVRPKGPVGAPFGGLDYRRGEAAAEISAFEPDAWSAIAVLTHDLEQDYVALDAALRSRAGYVGALGSRRRLPERRERLVAGGLDAKALQRLHAPIGLPIGGKAPWEIAVAVLAEIVAALRPPPAADQGDGHLDDVHVAA